MNCLRHDREFDRDLTTAFVPPSSDRIFSAHIPPLSPTRPSSATSSANTMSPLLLRRFRQLRMLLTTPGLSILQMQTWLFTFPPSAAHNSIPIICLSLDRPLTTTTVRATLLYQDPPGLLTIRRVCRPFCSGQLRHPPIALRPAYMAAGGSAQRQYPLTKDPAPTAGRVPLFCHTECVRPKTAIRSSAHRSRYRRIFHRRAYAYRQRRRRRNTMPTSRPYVVSCAPGRAAMCGRY